MTRTITALSAALAFIYCTGVAQSPSTLEITAVPSTFSPNSIVLHAGETTHLRFVHTDGLHGIESKELGIPATAIESGKTTDVAVTPHTAGTYVIHCQIYCGPNHDSMTLTVKVES